MKRLLLLNLALLSSALFTHCQTLAPDINIDYFVQKPPGNTPVIFAPNIISLKKRFERVPAFSPDGKELFFTVTTADWAPQIMHAKFENGAWTSAEPAFVAKGFNNTEPVFSPDGKNLFFVSNRPPGSLPYNYKLWMAERKKDGWAQPRLLGSVLNANTSNFHPSITNDGTLYFASIRDAEKTGPDIYRSQLINGQYQTVERLSEAVNSKFQEWDPYVSPDETFIIFKSERPKGYGHMDLYISFKNQDGSWTNAKNMGPKINTAHHDDAADMSPDGKYLFFARKTAADEMDIYWVSSKIVEDLRKSALMDIDTHHQ